MFSLPRIVHLIYLRIRYKGAFDDTACRPAGERGARLRPALNSRNGRRRRGRSLRGALPVPCRGESFLVYIASLALDGVGKRPCPAQSRSPQKLRPRFSPSLSVSLSHRRLARYTYHRWDALFVDRERDVDRSSGPTTPIARVRPSSGPSTGMRGTATSAVW